MEKTVISYQLSLDISIHPSDIQKMKLAVVKSMHFRTCHDELKKLEHEKFLRLQLERA